jgi:NADH-quinone oxidoreductase subunit J
MESIQYAVFLLGAVFCAYRAIVAKRILSATIYLACISALVSAVIYLLGAAQVAVMELSVGAGLVTVLLVYALSVVGDDALDPASVIPKPLAFLAVGTVVLLLGLMVYPAVQIHVDQGTSTLANVLWQNRVLDVWIQIALIFSGVMGVLGLLSEQTSSKNQELLQ